MRRCVARDATRRQSSCPASPSLTTVLHQPSRRLRPRHGPGPSRAPGAIAGPSRRPSRTSRGSLDCAAWRRRRRRARRCCWRIRPPMSMRLLGVAPGGGRVPAARCRHGHEQRNHAGRSARLRRRGAGRRRGDGQARRQCLRGDAAAWSPCRARRPRWASASSIRPLSRPAMPRRAHGAERVAIVDFDVHHGNGTQDIFWDDPSVLYCSTHQMPLYPGTGAAGERGDHDTIVNAPLAARRRRRGVSRRDGGRDPAAPRRLRARPHRSSRQASTRIVETRWASCNSSRAISPGSR